MEVTVSNLGEVTHVAPKGSIDGATSAAFGERLKSIVGAGCNRIVVDMQDVGYVSSAGFRCLLIAQKDAQRAGGQVALCGLSREVRRLFEIAAFTDIFLIGSSVDDCVTRLTRPA